MTQDPRTGWRLRFRITSPVKIQEKPGGKVRTLRPEDARIFVEAALAIPLGSKERQLCQDAVLLAYRWGLLNEHGFRERDNRRGREPGAHLDDAEALALMTDIACFTGEKRPYTLAGVAVDVPGAVPRRGERASRRRRLVERWKKLHPIDF